MVDYGLKREGTEPVSIREQGIHKSIISSDLWVGYRCRRKGGTGHLQTWKWGSGFGGKGSAGSHWREEGRGVLRKRELLRSTAERREGAHREGAVRVCNAE